MEPINTTHGRLSAVSDELLFSLGAMDEHMFEDVLAVCDGHDSGLADTPGMQPYCDAILPLDTDDLEQLYVARDHRSAPYNNAFGVGGGRGGRGGGRARGRGGFGGGRGTFGRGSGGPPPKGRNAPYGSYLTSYRKDDNHNSGFNSLSGQSDVYNNRANTLDRKQATIDKVHNELRANRERGKIE